MIRNGKILILEDVVIDPYLPKHKKVSDPAQTFNNVSLASFSQGFDVEMSNRVTIDGSNSSFRPEHNLEYLKYMYSQQPSLKLKLKIWAYKKFFSRNKKNQTQQDLTLINLQFFFDALKNNTSELQKTAIDEILAEYTTVLDNAKQNNQTALIQKLLDYVKTLQYESILSLSKFNKYLTEEEVAKFYNMASSHEKYRTKLCLTYIKNFVKIIPADITKLKKEADELRVFDNYVILHYDYSGTAVEDTKEEKEKKKDPILFGVIKDSKNLYYIGDWVDDYCDLTLDVIIKKLGKKTKKDYTLSANVVKNNITKI